ncbi:LysR family transcriptional regulator [Pseudoduganella chitinolytica]|uniref:LysR family transcriptional regulator n=1 Tax=Pseudoduganella chitinolytica TaxID=34070 RepID=A0ABY8BBR3_9BURK|nr:LysR family transcriptional regulator [Pseudoduganella chitinolytica]WEF33346.1 LysR family transcriptional regulator [Pseudoduganella chitinolytica]
MALPGQIDLNDLVVFAAVVEAGGFSAAAQRLGVAPAKVSVEVARLESRLGVALFARTTRRVVPTEAGEALHARCAPLLQELRTAIDTVHAPTAALTGNLRVTAPIDLSSGSVAPALSRFAQSHPALSIDLRSADGIADLVAEGIDVAIRMGWLRDSSLRAVKLGEFEQYIVASPDYLARVGMPQVPDDLAALDWIAMTRLPTPLTWQLAGPDGETRTVQTRARLKADSSGALRALLLGGAGISILHQYAVQDDLRTGRLVRVLPQWSAPRGGTWAVVPPGRHLARNAQAFIAFYREHLRGWAATQS